MTYQFAKNFFAVTKSWFLMVCLLVWIVYSHTLQAAPGDTIFEEQFNNTGDFTGDWTESGSGNANVNNLTVSSSPNALSLDSGDIIVTTINGRIDASVPGAQVSVWVRRGADSFSEDPDSGENLIFEYENSSGTWIELQTWTGAGTQGQIFTPTFQLPANALYSGLRIRFRFLDANNGFDYWHIDDVVVTETAAVTAPSALAEWRLDEDIWDGTTDQVLDSSGNDLHGRTIAVNSTHPTTDDTNPVVAGNPGTCRYGVFDGTNDGYVRIDDPGTGSILDLPTNFSVAVWVYAQSWPASGLMTIVSKDENFEFHLNSSGRVNWWWGGGVRELTSTGTVPINEWHHIAITYESGSQIIYIDGVAQGSNGSTSSITLNNDPVFIGTDLNFNSRNFDGFIDEVYIYNTTLNLAEVGAVMSQTHPCPSSSTLDHFAIDIGGGSASTCAPQNIIITAEDAGNNTISGYTGDIVLSTSTNHGDWSNATSSSDPGLGTLTPGALDSGAANYSFESTGADEGEIILDLSNSHAETLTITVQEAGGGVTSVSGNLTFSENVFSITENDGLADDVIAGRTHNYRLQMLRRDPATGTCGPATEYNVADVKMWLTRSTADPGGAAPTVTNNSATDTETLPESAPVSANFTLPFVAGVADFTLNTTDVGHYALNILDDSLSFADVSITGATGDITVRPFGFDIDVSGNPGASSAVGSVFTTAGSNFTVTVRAVAWSSADDSNDDGVPDGHESIDTDPSNNAPLNDNNVLLSFGTEIPPESVTLRAALNLPSGGATPGLSDGDPSIVVDGRVLNSFVNGIDTTNAVNYSEVGIMEISAEITAEPSETAGADYLSAGVTHTARMRSVSGYVGRFTPARFGVSPGTINAACTAGQDFSYIGENFSTDFSITAYNAAGAITTNYRGNFVKLDASLGNMNFSAIDASVPTPLSARINSSAATFDWTDSVSAYGIGDVNATLVLNRSTSVDGPFALLNIGVLVTDNDNITIASSDFDLDSDNNGANDSINLGQTVVRFGRLRLADAFGPESADLPVDFLTEYWNGSIWVLNDDDSCTSIALNAITYPDGTINVPANRIVTIGSGSTTGQYAILSATDISFANGDAEHFFSAPGSGNTGSFGVDVDLLAYPWLQFNWDGSGGFDTSLPTANYSFGSYRGHDRIIYWQEVLE